MAESVESIAVLVSGDQDSAGYDFDEAATRPSVLRPIRDYDRSLCCGVISDAGEMRGDFIGVEYSGRHYVLDVAAEIQRAYETGMPRPVREIYDLVWYDDATKSGSGRYVLDDKLAKEIAQKF